MQTAEQLLKKWYTPLHRSEIADLCIEEAMKEYAAQFIDLAAEQAKISTYYRPFSSNAKSEIDKQSILKIKKQIK